MTVFLRTVAWSLAAAVAFATLGPPRYRPHADLGQNGEHALAFALVGLAFGLAYRRNSLLTTLVALLIPRGIEVITAFGISSAAPTVPPTIAPTGPPTRAPSRAPCSVVDCANAEPDASSDTAISETARRFVIMSSSG